MYGSASRHGWCSPLPTAAATAVPPAADARAAASNALASRSCSAAFSSSSFAARSFVPSSSNLHSRGGSHHGMRVARLVADCPGLHHTRMPKAENVDLQAAHAIRCQSHAVICRHRPEAGRPCEAAQLRAKSG